MKRSLRPSRCLLGAVAAIFVCSADISAQGLESQSMPAKSVASFYGLTEAQISARFGKPDEVRSKPTGAQEWVYGRSVIFLSGGKVTAWSDSGELQKREKIASLQSGKEKPDDSLSGEWVNPWTPPKRAKSKESGLEEFISE